MSDIGEQKEFPTMKRADKTSPIPAPPAHAARKGFVSAPSGNDLKPTEREAFLLETLWNWHETSAKSAIILGQPLGR
jgi:hypothetical protein